MKYSGIIKRFMTMMLSVSIIISSPSLQVFASDVDFNNHVEIIEPERINNTDDENSVMETSSKAYNPRRSDDGNVVWDCVYFGTYNKSKIRWRVLNVSGSTAFVLSDYAIDCVPFDTTGKLVTWKDCELRSWLNNSSSSGFLGKAFTDSERAAILTKSIDTTDYSGNKYTTNDKVFLLSSEEVTTTKYGFYVNTGDGYNSTIMAKATNLALIKSEPYYFDTYTCSVRATNWALRNGDKDLGTEDYLCYVTNNGFLDGISPPYDGEDPYPVDSECPEYFDEEGFSLRYLTTRPAMYIDLTSSFVTPAGIVCSDGRSYDAAEVSQGGKPATIRGCTDFDIWEDTFGNGFDDINNESGKYWNYSLKKEFLKTAPLFEGYKWDRAENANNRAIKSGDGAGWCYGLAAVMGLFYSKIYNCQDYGGTVDQIVHNSKIDSLISYYFMFQFLDFTYVTDKEEILCKRLIANLDDGQPCLFSYKTNEGGHTVLTYAYENTNSYYKVYYVDPSVLRINSKTLVNSWNDNINIGSIRCNSPSYIYIDKNNYKYKYMQHWFSEDCDYANEIGVRLTEVTSIKEIYNHDKKAKDSLAIMTNVSDFKVTTASGKTPIISGPYYTCRDEESGVNDYARYYIDDYEDINITNEKKLSGNFVVTYSKENMYEEIESNAENISFSQDGTVSYDNAEGKTLIATTIYDEGEDNSILSVTSECTNLCVSMLDGNYVLNSKEIIGDVIIKVDDNKESKFSIKKNKATVEIENGVIVVDSDNSADPEEKPDGGEDTPPISNKITKNIDNTGYKVEYIPSVSYNGVAHIEKGGKISASKAGDVEITLYDPSGAVISPSRYKVSFKNNKDTYGIKNKQPYFTIKLKDKVDKDIKNAFKNATMEFDINPCDIGSLKLSTPVIKETKNGYKVSKLQFTNETGKVIKLKQANAKGKGDFTVSVDNKGNLILEGIGNYTGKVKIRP